jgi:hypothetical protein
VGLADGFLSAFAARDITVLEAILVSGGRWRSYLCDDPQCCGPQGTPLRSSEQTPSPLAVAATVAGLPQGLMSRRDIEATFAPLAGEQAASQARALKAAAGKALAGQASPAAVVQRLRTASWELLEAAFEVFMEGATTLDEELAAQLILGLMDKHVRDWAIKFNSLEQLPAAQWLWREPARRCVEPYEKFATAPLTLLAWTSWLLGDQAAARVALGRVLDLDPDYTLATLFYLALNQGGDPEHLRTIADDVPPPGQDDDPQDDTAHKAPAES